jgi:hypothetical protein
VRLEEWHDGGNVALHLQMERRSAVREGRPQAAWAERLRYLEGYCDGISAYREELQ